jgi:hypothetical protein
MPMVPSCTVRFCNECPVWDACEGIALRLSKDKGREQRCTVFDVEAMLRSPMLDPFLDQGFRLKLVELRQHHNPHRVCLPEKRRDG